MIRKWFVLIIFILLLCNSCATQALWENTNPNEHIKIEYSIITEEELVNRGVKYIKDDNSNAFYVEKSFVAKFADYSLRTLGTPLTVTVDAILIIAVANLLPRSDKY